MERLNIVFFGTSDFAVPSLRALHQDDRFTVTAVVTQPDRPVGRRQKLQPSAVKLAAEALGIRVFQFESVKSEEALRTLADLEADAHIVVSYGQILSKAVLSIPKLGSINVHGSILPKHRGASPIAGAIASGDAETGVTIMLMDEKMDHGPILAIAKEPIRADDTTEALSHRLAKLGGELLPQTTWEFANSRIAPRDQPHDDATFVKILSREAGRIDWHMPAEEIERLVRAFIPWPGTFFELDGKRVKVLKAELGPETDKAPGIRFIHEGSPAIACGNGTSLILTEIQPEGKRAMRGDEFLRGNNSWI